VVYLGFGFYLPHAERDANFKACLGTAFSWARDRRPVDVGGVEKVSRILLCKYDAAHVTAMRKKYAPVGDTLHYGSGGELG
jgi:hypothetical protein